MAPPSGTYVDIVHGNTVNGPVQTGGPFSWYNSGGNPNCTVTNVGTWCDKSSYGPIGAGLSVSAQALSGLTTGSYGFACACCLLGSPSVGVHGGHPVPPKK
jgi:hypothetical protein